MSSESLNETFAPVSAVRDLSEEEKMKIIMSEEFSTFFDKTTRIVERALGETGADIFVDYSAGEREGTDEYVGVTEGRGLFNNALDTFYLRLYGVGCMVTDEYVGVTVGFI